MIKRPLLSNACRISVSLLLVSLFTHSFFTQNIFAQKVVDIHDNLQVKSKWENVDRAKVRQRAFDWLKSQKADEKTIAKAIAMWPVDDKNLKIDSVKNSDLLSRFISIIALRDQRAVQIVQACLKFHSPSASPNELPDLKWLSDTKQPSLLRNNLKLLVARTLTQNDLIDESLELIRDLKPQEVVDPAALLFYRSIAHHRLLNVPEAIADLEMLLERKNEIPRRYSAIARLLLADIRTVKPDSLDHIARRMDDIRRRLKLGRTNKKVMKIEDGVIESLDKIIKEMEKKRQQQQVANNRGGNSNPAEQSRAKRGKGDGKVDKKNIGHRSGWGKMKPKDREQALQRVSQQFPSHYRELVEEYFRSIAQEKNPTSNKSNK